MELILADDQVELREAYKCLLEDQVGICVMNEAASEPELLAQLAESCPDLVLLDWELSGTKGVLLLERAREICPEMRVVALSVRPEARDEALHAGAQGFVSKGDPPERLMAAIRTLMCGTGI
jgi:DNA-binding NarL/FixJ family response regulator